MGSLFSKSKEGKKTASQSSSSASSPSSSSKAPSSASSSSKASSASSSSAKPSSKPTEKVSKDGADDRLTLEEATAETDALYKKYRAEVDKHAKLRTQYYDEASEAHKAGDGKRAKELSEKGKEEGRLMEEAGLKAARAIFDGKNKKQPEGVIDLHGLQVKDAEMIVTEQIEKAKKKGMAELKIIIGAGHHSDANGPKVGPAVKKLLSDNGTKWHEDNTNASGGAIIATI